MPHIIVALTPQPIRLPIGCLPVDLMVWTWSEQSTYHCLVLGSHTGGVTRPHLSPRPRYGRSTAGHGCSRPGRRRAGSAPSDQQRASNQQASLTSVIANKADEAEERISRIHVVDLKVQERYTMRASVLADDFRSGQQRSPLVR